MTGRFDLFILLAEMRTGSNLLESSLNAYPGLTCHGEAFNPHFIGYPNREEVLGISHRQREANPLGLLEAMRRSGDGLSGFRFFHDHDSRVLDHCLPDPRCAKILLSRNPVESYVSWKIARATDQWKLTNVKHKRSARVRFDPEEFEERTQAQRAFRDHVQRALQVTGQTAFFIDYEDLHDVEVINGLADFLGETHRLDAITSGIKKQNPAPLSEKVTNHAEMKAALSARDPYALDRVPSFEPVRGPGARGHVTAKNAPLLYMPVRGPQAEGVTAWLAAADGVEPGALETGMSQKALRQWKRRHPGHRSFTVVSHPAPRAHWAFCRHILGQDENAYPEIRKTLRKVHKLPLPEGAPDEGYGADRHRAAFLAFLEFLKLNLAGQTGIRVDQSWASQSQALQDMCRFTAPDMILRAEDLQSGLAQLADQVGLTAPAPQPLPADNPFPLSEIYDEKVEAAARAAYQRDYMMFGYGPWA